MRKIHFFTLMLLLPCMAFGPKKNYKQQYGEHYNKAKAFCQQHQQAFDELARRYDSESKMMQSIIFPELIRYNQFKDLFENTALEVGYVNGGTQWADFSIGYFQMKPSFVERLENELANGAVEGWKAQFQELCRFDEQGERAQRAARLQRMQSLDWQLRYLACFQQLAQQRYSKTRLPLSPIQYIATMYNAGFQKSDAELARWANRASFPYGANYPEAGQDNYGELARWFYETKI